MVYLSTQTARRSAFQPHSLQKLYQNNGINRVRIVRNLHNRGDATGLYSEWETTLKRISAIINEDSNTLMPSSENLGDIRIEMPRASLAFNNDRERFYHTRKYVNDVLVRSSYSENKKFQDDTAVEKSHGLVVDSKTSNFRTTRNSIIAGFSFIFIATGFFAYSIAISNNKIIPISLAVILLIPTILLGLSTFLEWIKPKNVT